MNRLRPAFNRRVQLAAIGALTMILVLWGGLYAVVQVSGTWRNAGEAERILRGIPAGGEEKK